MPSRPEDALATMTADGWVEIGVMADSDHPHDWRVWLNVRSGEGRLRVWWRSGSTWWTPHSTLENAGKRGQVGTGTRTRHPDPHRDAAGRAVRRRPAHENTYFSGLTPRCAGPRMEAVAEAIPDDADGAWTRAPRDAARSSWHPHFPDRPVRAEESAVDDHAFDQLSRAMARGLPRRTLLTRLGAGGLGAALFGAASLDRVRSAVPAAQAATCQLDLVASVRLGASAGVMIGGAVPGELRGQLSFGFDDGGAISGGRLRLADGKELPVVGQALGRALHLRVQMGKQQPLILVGTAEQDLATCQGAVDGMLTGPQAGDLGDWHALATSLGQRGAASGAASGGSSGSGGASGTGSSSGSGSATTPRGMATSEATGEATADATSVATTTTEACPAGQTRCGQTCSDLTIDNDHCGDCATTCFAGERCVNGVCLGTAPGACGAGLTNCFGACVDLQSDLANCGACGTSCPTFCQGGVCVDDPITCPETLTLCGGTCVDSINDRANCGGCGNVCKPDEACLAGQCLPSVSVTFCAAGLTDCGGTCVDLSAHAGNCGACGNSCPLGGICQGGVCV